MFFVSIVAIVIGLISVFVMARILYKHSSKNSSLDEKKSNLINGVILGFVFFCMSSVSYVILINII